MGFGVQGFVDSWRVWFSLGSGILELRVIKGFRAIWLWIESLESSLVAMLGRWVWSLEFRDSRFRET